MVHRSLQHLAIVFVSSRAGEMEWTRVRAKHLFLCIGKVICVSATHMVKQHPCACAKEDIFYAFLLLSPPRCPELWVRGIFFGGCSPFLVWAVFAIHGPFHWISGEHWCAGCVPSVC